MSIILLRCNIRLFLSKNATVWQTFPAVLTLRLLLKKNRQQRKVEAASRILKVTVAQFSSKLSVICHFFDTNGSKEIDLVTMSAISRYEITDNG